MAILAQIWKFVPFGTRSREMSAPFDELIRLMTTDAMANRVAVNRNALYIYNEMLDVGAHGDATKAGGLAYKLVAALATESGRAVPNSPEKFVDFLKDELKGFDTAEAKERAEGARLAAIKDLLSGRDK